MLEAGGACAAAALFPRWDGPVMNPQPPKSPPPEPPAPTPSGGSVPGPLGQEAPVRALAALQELQAMQRALPRGPALAWERAAFSAVFDHPDPGLRIRRFLEKA